MSNKKRIEFTYWSKKIDKSRLWCTNQRSLENFKLDEKIPKEIIIALGQQKKHRLKQMLN